jgi:hypothetical protein
MEIQDSAEVYTTDWFRARALSSLKKISDHEWDYSDSLLLYAPGAEGDYESIQNGEDPYAALITKPERTYLEGIATMIVETLPAEFEYVDLGPGTAHKEQFIFDAAKQANKKFIYRPVDISQHYLAQAVNYAVAQNIEVLPVRSSFEELSEKLPAPAPSSSRFVSLGLTFTNYATQEILLLLKTIADRGGYIFIDAQMRDRVDMKKIIDVYSDDVRAMADSKLKLLGLHPTEDVADYTADDGVRMWCTLQHSTAALQARGVAAGDRLLMFQSLRYTKGSFEEALKSSGLSYTLFDTNEPFVGAVLQVS